MTTMTQLKFISGHSKSLARARDYFEGKDGERTLAFDSINVARVSAVDPNLTWDKAMDKLRETAGNNRDHGSKKARTYEHIIVALDEKDSDVALDDFRAVVMQWCERFFNGGIGRYQVAVLYHDDNSERLSKGKDGILHAHAIVNNTDLDTYKRIASKLTKDVIDDMYAYLNELSLAQGWHGFTTDGRSLTQAEMARVGAHPSRRRWTEVSLEGQDRDTQEVKTQGDDETSFLKRLADIGRKEGAGHQIRDTQEAADDSRRESTTGIRLRFSEGDDVLVTTSETKTEPKRPANDADNRGLRLRFADGTTYDVGPTNQPSRPSMAERKVFDKQGHTWKQDVRQRVDVAMKLATSAREFRQILGLLDVSVSFNDQDEIKYTYAPNDAQTHEVLGRTLGKDYDAAAVATALSSSYSAQRQRAHDIGTRERPVQPQEQAAIVSEAVKAKPETRSGTREFERLKAFIAYNEQHKISGYGDFPDTKLGRAIESYARKIHAFDTVPRAIPTSEELESMTAEQRISIIESIREERGEGGREYGADQRATGTQASRSPEPGSTEPRTHNINR